MRKWCGTSIHPTPVLPTVPVPAGSQAGRAATRSPDLPRRVDNANRQDAGRAVRPMTDPIKLARECQPAGMPDALSD